MSTSIVGLKRIMLWKKGVVPPYSDPALAAISLDVRKSSNLVKTDETVKDTKGRDLKNWARYKAEVESYNIDRPLWYYLLEHLRRNGVDCEFLAEATAVTDFDPLTRTFGGCFRFDGQRFMGLDVEYQMTKDERIAKLSFEVKMPKVLSQLLLDDAVTNEPLSFIGLDEYSPSQMNSPYLDSVKFGEGSGTVLFDIENLLDMNFTMKTKGRKSIYDRTICDFISVEGQFTVAEANKDKLQAWENLLDANPRIVIKQNNGGGKYEEHIFNAKVLSLKSDFEISDEKREVKIVLAGDVPVTLIDKATGSYGSKYTYYI
ncbi:MAG: hypothetical protein LCH52_05445 [Bacteroidetes bacterium]|nr:hypothetical protein [Bacteroidota bacterium]